MDLEGESFFEIIEQKAKLYNEIMALSKGLSEVRFLNYKH